MDLYDRFQDRNSWTRFIVFAIFGALVSHLWSSVRSHYDAAKFDCLLEDEIHGVCKIWALYNMKMLKSGEYGDVVGHVDNCVQSGGWVQHGVTMRDGGLVLTCVHD
jgi:hypothetical protein